MAKYQAEFKAARYKSEPVKKAEAELGKLRSELARVRKEKRQMPELVGTYAVMIEQLARERAEVQAERDEALAARDAALGVSALPTTPPQQRAVPSGGRARRPLPPRGRR
jgi:chromosome segregation ATPase